MKSRPPLTVLMLVQRYFPLIGGAERQTQLLAEALVKEGHRIIIVTGQHQSDLPREETLNGVRILRFSYWHTPIKLITRLSMVFSAWWFTRSLFKHLPWDVIHVTQVFWLAALAIVLKKKHRTPVIAKSANSGTRSDVVYFYKTMRFMQYPARLLGLRDWVFQNLDRIVCINSAMVDEFAAAGVAPERLVQLSNGVRVPAKLPLLGHPKTWQLLTLIRMVEQKNPLLHLEVLQELIRLGTSVHYNLLGEGALLDTNRQFVSEHRLKPYVALPGGIVHEVVEQEYLPQADLYLHLTQAEGMSNSVLEAMAAGVPTVLSAVPGNTDLAGSYDKSAMRKHGWALAERALLVDLASSPALIASGIVALMRNDSRRTKLRTAAWQFVLKTASMESVARQYTQLYTSALGTMHHAQPNS